jgi:hypothetical protein
MDTLKRSDLQELIETQGEWHVSLYLPTHRAGTEQQQDPIRLKNLMAEAQEKLMEYGVRRPDVEEMLRPLEELLSNREFWQHQSDGLAIFLADGVSRIHRLPRRFNELVVVGKKFHVQPLLPLFSGNGNFYILALNLNQTRLYLGSRDDLSEIEMENMPTSLADSLEDLQTNLGFHTSTDNSPSGGGERPAIFYGQGVEYEKKEDVMRYFQHVEEVLAEAWDDESAPMVIAGVDYLIPIYREVSTYRNLLDEDLSGSPARQDLRELHEQAWELVEPIFTRSQEQAMDRFLELLGQENGLATSDLDAAVQAAIGGRVETLIVPTGVQKWGRYDPAQDSVVFDPESTPENEDMINFAAAQTILNSGNVYAVPADQVPGDGDVAAILRYVI